MADLTLTKTRIQAGIYEALLQSADPAGTPDIGAYLNEQPVGTLELAALQDRPGHWEVRLSLPAEVLTDGVQTFLIIDMETGVTLDSFAVLTGEPVSDDLRGELDLLRAELDMLKKAFRRHCVETS